MQSLTLLIKPASGRCNMRCAYCFYTDMAQARRSPDRGLMSPDTLEALTRRALAETSVSCAFCFQGGEPTLAGLDFYRTALALQRKHNLHGAHIQNSIQTNGLLIDDEWAAFFAEHGFLVGLSIDAGRETHDAPRPDIAGHGTHARCLRAAELLKRHGAQFNVLTVITAPLAQHPQKAYAFYRRHDFGHLQFIPCLDTRGVPSGGNPYSLSPKAYGRFLCTVFDLWHADLALGRYVSIRAFDNYVRMLLGQPPESCAMSGRCQACPVVEADGSVYPCDFYALDPYRLGSVHQHSFAEMLHGDVAARFVRPSLTVHERCGACAYGLLCRGGCRRDREPMDEDAPALNRYCESYQQFFAYALPRLRAVAEGLARP